MTDMMCGKVATVDGVAIGTVVAAAIGYDTDGVTVHLDIRMDARTLANVREYAYMMSIRDGGRQK